MVETGKEKDTRALDSRPGSVAEFWAATRGIVPNQEAEPKQEPDPRPEQWNRGGEGGGGLRDLAK